MKLPEYTGLSVHKGRKGGNQLDVQEGLAIARTLIAQAKAGLIYLRDVDPTPPGGTSQHAKIVALEGACEQFDNGAYVLLGVTTSFMMKAGDHRRSSVQIVYHKKGETQQHEITAKWRLPD